MHSPGTVCRLGKLDPKTVAVVRLVPVYGDVKNVSCLTTAIGGRLTLDASTHCVDKQITSYLATRANGTAQGY